MSDIKVWCIGATMAINQVKKAMRLCFKEENVVRVFKMKTGIKSKSQLNREDGIHLRAGDFKKIFNAGMAKITPNYGETDN